MEGRVAKLTVAAPRSSLAWRGAALCQDALRTCSLDDDRSLVFLPRLDLGRVPPGITATALALHVSRVFRRASPVRFPSTLAAQVELARRIAARQDCSEWFWPRVAPGFRPADPRPLQFRAVFQSVALTPTGNVSAPNGSGAVAAAEWLSRLAQLGHAREIVDQMVPADILDVFRSWGWRLPPSRAGHPWPGAAELTNDGVRALFTGALLTVAARPATAARADLLETITPAAGKARYDAPADAAPALLPDSETGLAGLYFLLNVLDRLGLPHAIDAGLVPLETPTRLLRLALDQCHCPLRDPARLAFEDETSRDPHAAWWLRRVRRWLRGHRLTLATLVVRPGRLRLEPPHIGITFALHACDLRVRLAGLDVDPGWLPWYGRIVRFHYVEGSR